MNVGEKTDDVFGRLLHIITNLEGVSDIENLELFVLFF